MAPSRLLLSLLALTAPLATAKIGFEGCTSTLTTWTYTHGHDIILWYLPDTGEVCDNPDCGGGRAPPKTDKPWCGNYKGTTTYSPMFIDLPTPTAVTTTTSAAPEPEETQDTDTDTGAIAPTTFLTSEVRETGDLTSSGAPSETQSENVTAAPSGTDVSSPEETSETEGPDDEDETSAPSGTDEENPPEETGAAAGVRVAAGMMAGLAAVAAGALAM